MWPEIQCPPSSQGSSASLSTPGSLLESRQVRFFWVQLALAFKGLTSPHQIGLLLVKHETVLAGEAKTCCPSSQIMHGYEEEKNCEGKK